jgi:hypothetical protein
MNFETHALLQPPKSMVDSRASYELDAGLIPKFLPMGLVNVRRVDCPHFAGRLVLELHILLRKSEESVILNVFIL